MLIDARHSRPTNILVHIVGRSIGFLALAVLKEPYRTCLGLTGAIVDANEWGRCEGQFVAGPFVQALHLARAWRA